MPDDLERAIAMGRWFADVTSTRTSAWRFGTALFQDDFPQRWDSNFLRVERPVGGATADELAADANELLGDFLHRELVLEPSDEGERLGPAFADLGYEVDRLVIMAQRRPVDVAPPIAAREVTFEEFRPVSVAANEESHGGMDRATAEILADFDRVARDRAGARFFLADIDGGPAAMASLRVHDGAAEVDSVHTLVAARGRGGARATVTAAIDAARNAGADLVWLYADANDWPTQLYLKLGFDVIGEFWQFTRPPPGSTYR